jgi:L,D-peptidoglycan transpeptidase YkuD (ErfK/YbiS/YcfS/YnhG family)
MDIRVTPDGILAWNGWEYRCALGKAGVTDAKREGDHATPIGCFPLRRVLYRRDRVAMPETVLSVTPIHPLDAWCDDPGDLCYNQLVRQPYGASFELAWRDDHIYDVIVILGYNDSPVVSGAGSAIFLHVAREDFSPTQGCVAVSFETLTRLLAECDALTRLCVRPR